MRDWDWLRPHTLNLYEYVGNDPINMWDPTGLIGTGSERQLLIGDLTKQGASGTEIKAALKIYDDVQAPTQEFLLRMSAETIADSAGDAFELSTGYTVTGEKGSHIAGGIALAIPFVSSRVIKGIGKVFKKLFTKAPVEQSVRVDLSQGSEFDGPLRMVDQPLGEGAEEVVTRTTRGGDPGVRITKPDGSRIDITPHRVKEDVLEPRAKSGLKPVKFENSIPGTKGKKRLPTQEDLDLLNKHSEQ